MKKLLAIFSVLFLTHSLSAIDFDTLINNGLTSFLGKSHTHTPAPVPPPQTPTISQKIPIKPVAVAKKVTPTSAPTAPSVKPLPKVVKKTPPPPPTEKPKKTAPAKKPAKAAQLADGDIEQLQLLLQPNGWECGYYSVFHYLATKHNYEEDLLEDLYAAFITDITQIAEFADAYEDEDYTNGRQLSDLVRRLGDLNEVLVIDEQELHGIIPTTQDVVAKINALRARKQTFWALVCTKRPAHWVCLMFPAAGGCISIDSLDCARPANEQPILVNVKNLCRGVVKLPNHEQYRGTRHAYRTVMDHQPPSAARTAFLAEIRTNALANGFTPQVYEALIAYLNTRAQRDHVPGSRGKKKSADVVILDDADKAAPTPKPKKRRQKKE